MTFEVRVKGPCGHSMTFIEEAETADDALEKFKAHGPNSARALKRSGGIICVVPATCPMPK